VIDVALDAAAAFGEDQGRYVVTAPAGVALPGATRIGTVGGDALVLNGTPVAVSALRAAHEGTLPAIMQGEIAA
jgi:phosphoribosylformylglycinamidine synthase